MLLLQLLYQHMLLFIITHINPLHNNSSSRVQTPGRECGGAALSGGPGVQADPPQGQQGRHQEADLSQVSSSSSDCCV